MLYNLLVTLVFFQLFVSFLLLLPYLQSLKVFLLSIVGKNDSLWTYFFGGMLAIFACMTFAILSFELVQLNQLTQSTSDAELFRDQRDVFVSLLSVVLAGFIHRYGKVMVEVHRMELNHTALEKQAKSMSESLKKLLVESIATNAPSAQSADSARIVELELKLTESNKSLKLAETNLDMIKKQAASQSAEYNRLIRENESLQNKLEDFQDVFGGAKKKTL